ncbi:MAG: carboxypeptidase regulatory-like domain-containing protein [Acidobacteriaceae bacterium]|nr:carboxypeptidase regulatory-like domain-containing protein [Acidobacteriaceae bacterium]
MSSGSGSTVKSLLFFLLAFAAVAASAQAPAHAPVTGSIHGTVTDPDLAVIPGADITLTSASGKPMVTKSRADGTYSFRGVAAGTYSLTITMSGFADVTKPELVVAAGKALSVDVKMAIEATSQEIHVSADDGSQVSMEADSNASSTVIKGKDLDALSDDPDELSSELMALAGPSAGPDGGEIYVDGFTGGQLPPKSSIREIRINQNPFSAQFDRMGWGRVEILTKPGTDKFHGQFMMQGNDSSFNALTPQLGPLPPDGVQLPQPPYHTIMGMGNISGPISSKSSFSFNMGRRQIQNNNLIYAKISALPGTTDLCDPNAPDCVSTPFQAVAVNPQTRLDITPRIDVALVPDKNYLMVRFQMYQNSSENNGVNGTNLLSTASNSDSSEYELQASDTQTINSRVINETRMELGRNRSTSGAVYAAPSVSVPGDFTSGGSGYSSQHDNRLELQNYTSVQLAKNFMRFGGRLRVDQRVASSTSLYGRFTYTTLDDYINSDPSTAGQNLIYQYSVTKQVYPGRATMADLGLYFEDEWKMRPNLTATLGARYETQNNIRDHHDIAPRVAIAYGLGSTNGAKGNPKTVLRGGWGVFYTRYSIGNIMSVVQGNGVNTLSLLESSDQIASGCSPTNLDACHDPATGNTTTQTAAPNLRTPYTMQAAIGVDQQLFHGATLSVNYLNTNGVHLFNGANLNANQCVDANTQSPTYQQTVLCDAGAPAQPVLVPAQFQYQSEGVFHQNQLMMHYNINPSRRLSLSGWYVLGSARTNTMGAGSMPSQPGNLHADYGRASYDVRNRFGIFGSITLPYNVVINPMLFAQSGSPYNIVTGTDLYNDTSLNTARPAFKQGVSANCLDKDSFNSTPNPATDTIIPVNYCQGSGNYWLNLRVAKTIGFGRETATSKGAQGGGSGGRGGGLRGSRGPGGMWDAGNTTRQYNMNFSAMLSNPFNSEFLSNPGGTLSSSTFGQSTQLAQQMRRVTLMARFTF